MWDRWHEFYDNAEITRVFYELGNMPRCVNDPQLDVLEKYVLFVYDPNIKNTLGLDQYRMREFECSLHNNIRLIPPSKIGLLEHVKRAFCQGGWIWQHCINNTELPDPNQWGWESINGNYTELANHIA